MRMKLTASIRKALQLERRAPMDDVHFHSGPGGRVFACDFARCDSPHLTAREAGAGQ